MKSKKVITLSLSDLKDLGVIPRKHKKNKKKKHRKSKIKIIDPNTGAAMGGLKSDSSQMKGFGMVLPQSLTQPQFSNTANLNTAIQQANLDAMESYNKRLSNPPLLLENNQPQERFPQANTTQLIEDAVGNQFQSYMLPYIQRQEEQQNQYNDRFASINGTINKGMDYVSQLGKHVYSQPQLNYSEVDSAGIVNSTLSSDEFSNEGNARPMDSINDTPTKQTRFDGNTIPTPPSGLGLTPFVDNFNEEMNPYNNLQQARITPVPMESPDEAVDALTLPKINPENLFKDLQSPESPDVDNTWADVKSPQQEATPSPVKKAVKVANLQDMISKNVGRAKNKGIKKGDALLLYTTVGGKDPKILGESKVSVIMSAYNKLAKK